MRGTMRVVGMLTLAWALGVQPVEGSKGAKIWRDILTSCADSALVGKTLYFGPSNSVATGAIWRKYWRGYGLRSTIDMIEPDQVKRAALVRSENPVSCSGGGTRTFEGDASVALSSLGEPLSGSLAADMERARTTTVRVREYVLEQIVEVAYESLLSSIEGPIGNDLANPNRYVQTRAFRINGLYAEIEFDRSASAEIAAKYDGKTVSVGGAEANLRVSADGKLVIEAEGPFYIAGELRQWKHGALAADTDGLGDVIDAGGKSAFRQLLEQGAGQ